MNTKISILGTLFIALFILSNPTPASAAQISRDNSAPFVQSEWNATSVSTAMDIAKKATLLLVFVYEDMNNTLTSVTANGSPLTQIGSQHMCYDSTGHTMSAWYITNPSHGNVTITANRTDTTTVFDIAAISYKGTSITAVPDAYASSINTDCITTESNTTDITTNSNKAWVVMASRGDNGGIYSGTGDATLISTGSAGDAINNSLFDTNAPISGPSTISMGANSTVAGGWVNFAVSIAHK